MVVREFVLEVSYLGVDPNNWGAGVGGELLAHIQDVARTLGVGSLELWVINDNERAVHLYERTGWRPTDEVKVRNDSGRPERRFVHCV
ncbi:GNAT family N-acetyltransferase [Jatrophihabitans lederbergiae]|uniref:GNAT family N-acetyltransferase n=1 Tax=Jatrophihabitans lederbergiae TaxID=3075547 RepID=UPI0037C03BAA